MLLLLFDCLREYLNQIEPAFRPFSQLVGDE